MLRLPAKRRGMREGAEMTENFRVGTITSTHGLQGEVKVFPTTDDPAKFKKLKKVYLENGSALTELEIAGVKFFKNMVILRFCGHDRIEDVEPYRGKDLYVPRKDAVKLNKDEYYIADLIGLSVVLEDGTPLGTLSERCLCGSYTSKERDPDSGDPPVCAECGYRVGDRAGASAGRYG